MEGGGGGAVTEHFPVIATELAAGFAQNERIRNTLRFLSERSMLSAGIEDTLRMNADWLLPPTNKSNLSNIISINESLMRLLNMEEDVLQGLLSFSKGSRMFAVRFDRARTDRPRGATIAECTRLALQGLRNLVRGDGVRIEEFGESLQNVLQELRRSSTKSSELEMISNYFSGEISGDVDASSAIIDKLNAAFDLVRLRQELRPFFTAVREQMIFSNRVVEELENNSSILNALGNFRLSDAKDILHGVNIVLSGLTIWEVAFVGRLSNAALLLEFLRRQGRIFESSGSLQRAQNRAATNEHASSVLLTLLPLNELLQPLYDPAHRLDSLADLKIHFIKFPQRFTSHVDRENRVPSAILELENLADNWSVIEYYFNDNGDNLAGTEVIERIVGQYIRTGKYISCLAGHQGGSCLRFSFRLQGKAATRDVVAPEIFQEQIQSAVVTCANSWGSMERNPLQDFVNSFDLASKVHALHLRLEASGHPDHQAIGRPKPLANSINISDLQRIRRGLEDEASSWASHFQLVSTRCPRLYLLTMKARLQLLLSCRDSILRNHRKQDYSSSARSICSFVAICFPTLRERRNDMITHTTEVLRAMVPGAAIDRNAQNDLDFAAEMIVSLESTIFPAQFSSIPLRWDKGKGRVLRLNLRGDSFREIYVQHLAFLLK